ncbi:papilin-like [Amblyomma americanum]
MKNAAVPWMLCLLLAGLASGQREYEDAFWGPKNPQSKCYDAVGYHPCRVANAGQRWHFDMLTKSCLRSQTCAEDRNNFHSREDCEYACPAYSFCLFPKVDQHCSNTTAQSQWFFDAKTHRCKKSANCVIGANAFVTRSECVSMCRAVDVCDAPRPLELCDSGQRTVWYYDPTSGQCLKDVNCHNRGNNFPSLQECRRVCVRRVSPVPMPSPVCYSFPPTHGCGRLMERWVYNLDAKRCERRFVCPKAGNSFVKRSTCEKTCPSESFCHFPRPTEDPACANYAPSRHTWYYDRHTRECRLGVGCHLARANSFSSRQLCSEVCRSRDVCSQHPLPHSCSEKERSVYSYNQDTKLCEKRSGCHNRGNNFPSMPECRKVCERRRSPEDCRHWPNRGPCYAFAFKWYYDHYHKNCFQFLYGGCNGGPNLFDSKEECLEVCFPHKRIPRGC